MPKIQGLPRASQHIARKVTQNAFRGFDFAEDSGTPLNIYVVVNMRETAAKSAGTCFAEVHHKYRDWLCYKQRANTAPVRPICVATQEHPVSGYPHFNWVLHVPPALIPEFRAKLPGWVAKVLGIVGPFDVKIKTVTPSTAKRLANYILKGTDPAFIDHFHLRKLYDRHGPQGTVYGKRAFISMAIGVAARRQAGWTKRRRRNLPRV